MWILICLAQLPVHVLCDLSIYDYIVLFFGYNSTTDRVMAFTYMLLLTHFKYCGHIILISVLGERLENSSLFDILSIIRKWVSKQLHEKLAEQIGYIYGSNTPPHSPDSTNDPSLYLTFLLYVSFFFLLPFIFL